MDIVRAFRLRTVVGLATSAAMLLTSTPAHAALTFDANTITTDGALTINGVAGSIYTIGTATTTGTITVGGTAQTGALTLGRSSGINTISIGGGTGATTIQIGISTGANVVTIGSGSTTGLSLTDDNWSVSAAGVGILTGLTSTGTVTLTGAEVSGGSPLVFEGATANAFETTLAVTEPTADRTITLPNATGTLALLSEVNTWTATQMITTTTATDDQINILAFSGGAAHFAGNITTADLTADRTYTFPDAAGTILLSSNNLSALAATTSAQFAGVVSDETGTGAVVLANTPTLITPVLGVATATSVAVGGGTALTKVTVGNLADDVSGWAPTGAATSFTITANAASVGANSLISVSVGANATATACAVSDRTAATSFVVACSAAPANGATLQYMIVN